MELKIVLFVSYGGSYHEFAGFSCNDESKRFF